MEEIWKPILGYPKYKVSNLGRIKSTYKNWADKEGRTLKGSQLSSGYLFMLLRSNNKSSKRKYIHRIVLESFIGTDPQKPYANHKNGIKSDNRLSNLEWVTKSYNAVHSYRVLHNIHGQAKLTENDVREIRSSKDRPKDLAEKYNVTYNTIHRVITKKRWKFVE
jgi:hypothetical protein